ncbi:MAG: hypothetical protein NVS9B15_01060 [Acidobacteriaceae bacterium]
MFFGLIALATLLLQQSPQPATTVSIQGAVTEEDGQPVSEAHVLVIKMSPEGTVVGPAQPESVSDDRGLFVVPNLNPGLYYILFSKSGYRIHARGNVLVTGEEDVSADVQLQRKNETHGVETDSVGHDVIAQPKHTRPQQSQPSQRPR